MKIKKMVSEKVLAANRANAKMSTGPKNMAMVTHNAFKHGLLSKRLRFESEEERMLFQNLLEALKKEQKTESVLQQIIIEDAAVSIWKLRATGGWDISELINRRKAAKAVMKTIEENYYDEQLQLFQGESDAARRGWDCQELVIRTGMRDVEDEDGPITGQTRKTGHVQMEAKLTSSLDTIIRYQTSVRRDLYRAIEALGKLRPTSTEEVGG